MRAIDEADVILVIGTDPLHTAPIIDLRIRKSVRRQGTRLAVACDRPSALDGGAVAVARYAPGGGGSFLTELGAALARGHEGETVGGDAGEIASLLSAPSGRS